MDTNVSGMERVSARLMFVNILFFVFVVISIAKLAGIQVKHHEEYLEAAANQQNRRVNVEANRGEIFDRNGFLLAGNLTEATYEVFWQNVPVEKTEEIDSLVVKLGDYTDLEVPVQHGNRNQVIAEGVTYEYATEIMNSISSYADCSFVTKRVYPMGEMMMPVVGSYNSHVSQGLERQMQDFLEGEDGVRYFQISEWSHLNAVDATADNIQPIHGRDLYLTIDARYQEIAMSELERAVEESGSLWGAIVIINPDNGDVLSLASYPVRNEDGSLAQNHCVQSSHEPGSVFKAITLAAALDINAVSLSDSFDCTESFVEIAGFRINESHPIGEFLDLTEVIAHSSNVGTVKLADFIPDSVLYQYCIDFGFGHKTRVDFPSEQSGLLTSLNNWSALSKANLAIGQEVAATPLQIAMAYGAIANGGLLYRPRLVASTYESGLLHPLAESPSRRVISEGTSATVRSILASVVTEGTGSSAQINGVTVAGKTGTAERLVEDGYLSAFAGMVPAENPKLVVVVVFDMPDYEYRWGSVLAAPTFQNVVSGILSTSPEIALGSPLSADDLIAVGGEN